MKVFYFGCLDGLGHFLHVPNSTAKYIYGSEVGLPWGLLDAVLCPGYVKPFTYENDTEGRAVLHYKDGFTALAFWDRSVDSRRGSNSVFIAEGTHDFEIMLKLFAEHFPQVRARLNFSIYLDMEVNHVKNKEVSR